MTLDDFIPQRRTPPAKKQIGVRLEMEDIHRLEFLTEQYDATINATVVALIRQAYAKETQGA